MGEFTKHHCSGVGLDAATTEPPPTQSDLYTQSKGNVLIAKSKGNVLTAKSKGNVLIAKSKGMV